MALPVRAESQRQYMRQLSDADIWKAVFPSFNEASGGLPEQAPTCTGEFLFRDPHFEGSHVRRQWPFMPTPGDLLFGSGPKRTKIVWFKTHEWGDGTVGGVVAMVRAEEDFAEVYGVGVFRGSPDKSRFATERVGGTVVLTATDDSCTGKPADTECESWIRVMMPWKGQLVEQATIAAERRHIAAKGEPGATGRVTYRMTGTPIFESTRVRVLEQVQVTDSAGRKLRQVELERRYDLSEGRLVERQPSLWDRVVGATNETTVDKAVDSDVGNGANAHTETGAASPEDRAKPQPTKQ